MVKRFFMAALLLAIPATGIFAQSASDYAVQIQAQVQQSPARIKITWKPFPNILSYTVYKKAKGSDNWSSPLVTLGAADTSYIDNNVIEDSAYEYQVIKLGNNVMATGFIYAGIKAPAIHHRGTILVLVDSLFSIPCELELGRLMRDLRGDGWQVVRKDIARSVAPPDVRAMIQATAQADANLTAVLLVGHIAVPYSGDLNPDGHADHEGAWPADVYYADLNNTWTDISVNIPTTGRPENKNIPGDGKWDQTTIPGELELQVSRIDFANMPAFTTTEVQMMKSYLNRDHIYKMDSLAMAKRALIDDNFGAFSGEAFAANAWRNFNPIVGRDSIKSLDLISTLNTTPYQWAYGCGGGTYTSAGGIGTTNDFKTNQVNSIFVFLFGSYFGDFDAQNDFLRAPLCSPTPALATYWAGRPNHFLHHMALGEHLGYSTLLSQNNDGNTVYTPGNYGTRFVHQALMGDLSLRVDYIKPAGKPTITSSASAGTVITWQASPDPNVTGYYVYRSESEFGYYKKRSALITGNSFLDSFGTEGMRYYMVRPAKMQSTPSGNYENLGIGTVDSGYSYYFGPDNVSVPDAGNMQVQLYPNPSKGDLAISIDCRQEDNAVISIADQQGRQVFSTAKNLREGGNVVSLHVQHLPAGLYFITVQSHTGHYTGKWIKN